MGFMGVIGRARADVVGEEGGGRGSDGHRRRQWEWVCQFGEGIGRGGGIGSTGVEQRRRSLQIAQQLRTGVLVVSLVTVQVQVLLLLWGQG